MARGTRFRWFVKSDEYRLRDMMPPMGHLVVPRDSAKARAAAVAAFVAELSRVVPVGPKAHGLLECAGPRETYTVLRATGRVTCTRIGSDGYCRVPSGGEWVSPDGTVLARAGAKP
jgi:hypothetical protein